MNTNNSTHLGVQLPTDLCLNPRQLKVLTLLLQGRIYKSIAHELNISLPAVRQNAHRLYKKLEVGSRIEAMIKYQVNDNKSYHE